MPDTFTQNLSKLMPSGMTLAPELTETFNWLEAQGWLHQRGTGLPEEHTLFIYPDAYRNYPVASHVAFGGTTLAYSAHWSMPDPSVDKRIFEIAETSGDGGRAAIWLDENGAQQFVHIGHDTLGVISDDPVVFLQFLAMGYPEPGYLPQTDVTPVQAMLDYHGMAEVADFGPDEPPVFPVAFQAFLKDRFELDMPATARDLGIADFAEYGDEASTDPFAQWINSVTPPPTEAELAYIRELEEMAKTINIADLKLDDPGKPKGLLGTLKGLFGPNK